MDVVQDWAGYLFRNGYLTPGIFGPLATLKNIFYNYLLPVFQSLLEKPDLTKIALMLVILYISLKLLKMLVSSVLFWFRLAFRISFWGGLVVLAFWLSQRGVDGAAEDVGYWFRLWKGELDHYKSQAEQIAYQHNHGYGGKSGYGGGYKPAASKKQWPF
ncbi:hypothetical protein E4T42_04443 [Aureobasidium subglaciale]|nr:hypothetical protein E4T42_04443 [Aureobasidium subglaciale]KAI5274272.1 hypothetical protein E4T47_02699 [Aureobasidium subglaciale]